MKKIFTLLSVALMSTGAFAQQAEFAGTINALPNEVRQPASSFVQNEYKQHVDDTLPTSVSAVRCAGSSNGWGRLFDLATEHGITTDFTVKKASIATILYPEGYVETKVYTVTDAQLGDGFISFDKMEETPYYGVATNSTTTRTWQWEEIEAYDEVTVPGGTKIYLAFEGEWAPATDTSNTGTFFPVYNEGGQTYSAYFGSPGTNCIAVEGGAASFTSIGSVGTTNVSNWAFMMKLTVETEDLGTVELGSDKLAVFPNPATTEVIVSLKDAQIAKVEVADVTGKAVPVKVDANGKVNVSSFAKGVYFLRVQDSKGVTRIQKFIKK